MKTILKLSVLAFALLLLCGCASEKIEKPDHNSDKVPENSDPGGNEDDVNPDDNKQTQTKGPVTLTLGKVTATTASFESVLDIETIDDYKEVGFIYSTVNEMDVESKTVTKVKITQEAYADTFTGLSYNTRYYYTIYLVRHNGICQYGETQTFKTDDITISVDDVAVTATTATITGKVVRDAQASGVKVGIAYGKSESSLKRKEVVPDAGGNYSLLVENLEYNSEYSYKSYVCQDGDYVYGKLDTFKTDDITISVDDVAVTSTTATFTGKVVRDAQASAIRVGIAYGTSSSSWIRVDVEPDEKGNYTLILDKLTYGKTYTYKTYVYQNEYIYGPSQTFTTLNHPYELSYNLNVASATDLSSLASANCYIVSKTGLYKFNTVKGNSTASVGTVASAAILWESFGTDAAPEVLELISGFCYKNGYIAFQTADTFKEGNAVIAAKDADGNILWSWHIWFTDQPQGQVYYNGAGTMMDRNLGATSATPGDVGALGLLYQWGRKDPFLGSSSISSNTVAKSTITWPSAVSSDSSNGTIAYATANPTTFIAHNSKNSDWYYTGSSSTNNTRWTTSKTDKSIYDPCPAGWRVPDGGSNDVWSKALGSSSYFKDDSLYNSTNEGMNFSSKFGSDQTIWYPASGCRDCSDGSLYYVGLSGSYWSAYPPSNSYARRLHFLNNGYVYPSHFNMPADCNSVRCLQE